MAPAAYDRVPQPPQSSEARDIEVAGSDESGSRPTARSHSLRGPRRAVTVTLIGALVAGILLLRPVKGVQFGHIVHHILGASEETNAKITTGSQTHSAKRLQVPGHTALGAGACDEANPALQKIKRIVGEQMHIGGPLERLQQVGKDLMEGRTGPRVFAEIEDVLNHANLTDALLAGVVVTSEDLRLYAQCEVGRLGSPPEEHWAAWPKLHKGDAILQGDMVATAESRRPKHWNETTIFRKLTEGGNQIGFDAEEWAAQTWEGGHVKYCFAPGLSSAARSAWQAGVEHVRAQVPCLTFEEIGVADDGHHERMSRWQSFWRWLTCQFTTCSSATSGNCAAFPSIYVQSEADTGCWSYVGQVSDYAGGFRGMSQPLNLGVGCETLGVAAHELGHALAMLHEQARDDRTQYISVHTDNIVDGMVDQFQMETRAYTGTTYDLLSLMHYSASAFSRDGSVTIEPHNRALTQYIGQRMGFSQLDIEHIGDMYGCKDTVTPQIRNAELIHQLAEQARVAHAPTTLDGCVCMENWSMSGQPQCSSSQNGWCCNPNNDPQGSWCAVQGTCQGRAWDYCEPRDTHEPVAPITSKGCTCSSTGQYSCATGANGFCCNGDSDPNGNWCMTAATCGGTNWDYCTPAAN